MGETSGLEEEKSEHTIQTAYTFWMQLIVFPLFTLSTTAFHPILSELVKQVMVN